MSHSEPEYDSEFDESLRQFELAREFMDKADFSEAIRLFESSLCLKANYKTALLLGECLLREHRPNDAIAPLAAATTLNRQGIAPTHLADALVHLGELLKAKDMIELACIRQPHFKRAQQLRQVIENKVEEFGKRLDASSVAGDKGSFTRDSNEAEEVDRRTSRLELGDFQSALDLLNRCTALWRDFAAMYQFAETLLNANRLQEAVVVLAAATTLHCEGTAPTKLAAVLLDLNDPWKAEELLALALKRQPNLDMALVLRPHVEAAVVTLNQSLGLNRRLKTRE